MGPAKCHENVCRTTDHAAGRAAVGRSASAAGRSPALEDEPRLAVVVILPRLARALHHPSVAIALGVILVAVGVIGLVSHEIAKGFAILIIVAGTINVLRVLPHNDQERSSAG
jgi:hypothetical protein